MIIMDNAPEEMALAVEIIRQLENLSYPADSILQAMIYICRDTLSQLPDEHDREKWRNKITLELANTSGLHCSH
ncbi:MAG: hypothetical protein QS748_09385 [Candidatus Endonucleobacter bathymodioli]|uniref:Uncharacterized protein n=1 Tax=Candidatus Endonucleibacter bathymodioli TaxID=539814 RepID=A0AA90NMB7_9GAMM|nr:hypothetical protein [Candidatus Endonucleobacter bathymodioli]